MALLPVHPCGEQNTVLALALADRGHVLENGRGLLEGAAGELNRMFVREAYFGP
ncbi:hypothetical protein [Mesorhizobium sp. M1348]|uniref:hypothetical protein n=1 Tax=Mesorhizobium sp. M1348 TaxID=2957089 RepID=UPI003336BCF6